MKTEKQVALDIEIKNIETIVNWDFKDHNLSTLQAERKSILKIKQLLKEERKEQEEYKKKVKEMLCQK